MLVGHRVLSAKSLAGTLLWGELAADGSLEATPGTSLAAELARAAGLRRVIVSAASAHEIANASGLDVWPIAHLANRVARFAPREIVCKPAFALGPPAC